MEYKYNDNELLYLFSEGVEEALEILFDKYVGLIRKRILSFKIQLRFRDDFFQEGQIALITAIRTYNPFYCKTFNKYFDLLLQRRFIKILKKEKNYIYNVTLCEDYSSLPLSLKEEGDFVYEKEYNLGFLSEFEKQIFDLYKKGKKAKDISSELNVSCKSVYNSVYRIKSKLLIKWKYSN